MQIDVSGRQFPFPTTCACCNGKADAELPVSASNSTGKRTNVWDIPYCQCCVKHMKAAEAAAVSSWVCGIFCIVGGAVLSYIATPYLGIPAAVVGLAGTFLLYQKLMAKASGISGHDCACFGKAVEYLSWHGTCHTFKMASLDYAFAFMVANQKKLVNLSPEAGEFLESCGYGPSHGVPACHAVMSVESVRGGRTATTMTGPYTISLVRPVR